MAALQFSDSLIDRILANNGTYPADYDPATDGPVPPDYAINGTSFSVTFMETYEQRFDDHVSGGPVVALETFWNIQPGGQGESEINDLVQYYSSVPNENKNAWVVSIARLFTMVEIDSAVGLTYRTSGANGYTSRGNLNTWIQAATVNLGGSVT